MCVKDRVIFSYYECDMDVDMDELRWLQCVLCVANHHVA